MAKRSRKAGKSTEGRQLFRRFLDANELNQSVAAAALGVTKASVSQWLREERPLNPSERMRELIEVWTGGAVPRGSWPKLTDRRKDRDHRVVPFRPGSAA